MEFDALKKEAKNEWQKIRNSDKPQILIGAATCGKAAGALEVLEAFKRELSECKIEASLTEVGCLGPCCLEPMVGISKPKQSSVIYGNVQPENVARLVKEWLQGQNPCSDLAIGALGDEPLDGMPKFFDHPMLAPQVRIVLKNCGWIDPTDIRQYIANDGYAGIENALKMKPEQVIAEVLEAGLRGRGGAGFPTGKKWQLCRNVKSDKKYMICNADEGDPGAFMNRSLLEGDTHAVLEGLLIAGYAIGATEAYIYIRAEYPLAIERLIRAIAQMKDAGLLGENILASDFSYDITIKEGAGAFVCGEETALIGSIEGKRGMPQTRPPFPAVSGLFGKPTIINNVETLGTLPHILRNGAGWYNQYGTEGSKGTKTFALAGKVQRTGLIEVPIGITLREIVYDVGGGIPDGKKFKAVQTGGPSGGCLPSQYLDSPVDYQSLIAAGSIMGSGGMIVMDEDTCAVDLAHYFLSFTQNESCGKCVPCRVGTKRMLEILEKIKNGLGTLEDIEILESIAETVKLGSLCGLGQSAPNTVLTTLRYFRDEYEAHIKYKQCPAVVCQTITFTPCKYKCPVDTDIPAFLARISHGEYHEAFEIIGEKNPFPIVTGLVCPHPCESRCHSAESGSGSISVRALKRFVSDKELETQFQPKPKAKQIYSEKVAVIGAGPAGMTAAFDLTLAGYGVTIFEKESYAGGMMEAAIPRYRLPQHYLKTEIEAIKHVGVEIKTGVHIGRDITMQELFEQDFKAVLVAAGAHRSMKLNIPEENVEGVIDGLEFLKAVNRDEEIKLGERVGIIGGGNVAIDTARTAWRQGKKVTIIYRRTRDEMPAFAEEIDEAFFEEIDFKFLTAPLRVITKNGKMIGLECIKMELGPVDESGRRRPIPIEGSNFTIELDTLLTAIGERPDISFIPEISGIKFTKWETLAVNPETLATNIDGIFAAGDVVSGPSTVVDCIAQGKLAAQSIGKYLRGENLQLEYEITDPSVYVEPVKLSEEEIEEMANIKRPEMPCLSLKKRVQNFDQVELGYEEATAIKEAKRCLRCDLREKH